MQSFIIFPAIDLRNGQVVRLKQGDPAQQTTNSSDAAFTALRWLEAGAAILNVINLDGAFGETQTPNWQALAAIVKAAEGYAARVQFGGGLRTQASIREAFNLGVERVILGTAAIEEPALLAQVLAEYSATRVAVSLDARAGLVQVRGWQEGTQARAEDTARRMAEEGVRWFVFTDIARDGVGSGINLTATRRLAEIPQARVVASGGVNSLEDVRQARAAGCAGIIIGRALYDGKIELKEALQEQE